MNVTPVVLPLDKWPAIICGPMVRRVTPTSVAIFVATSYPANVKLIVYDSTTASTEVASYGKHTIALGRNFHSIVIEVKLSGGKTFNQGIVYGYDVAIFRDDDSSNPNTLATLGLLKGKYPLGYIEGQLPSFVLPEDLQNLQIAHGSCRKSHGGGFDGLAELDQLILEQRDNTKSRPQQLFLTGDQIYADDVAEGFLRTLTATGNTLLGWTNPESIFGGSGLARVDSASSRVEPGFRYYFLKPEITSGAASNHLIFLGEFYAMYLMVWSDALWPQDDKGNYALTRTIDNEKEQYDASTKEVLSFATMVPLVRRALANIATYMILDDHEVTDDWNLHGKWEFEARNSEKCSRVIRNALIGYAVFQDWGNQPESYRIPDLPVYKRNPGAKLLELAALRLESNQVVDPVIADDANHIYNELLNLRDPKDWNMSALLDVIPDLDRDGNETGVGRQIRWDFVVEGPRHRVIFLNTRTWRSYWDSAAKKSDEASPNLLCAQALKLQVKDRYSNDAKLVFMVSPAPVLGQPFVEEFIKGYFLESKWCNGVDHYARAAEADLEAWSANRQGFEVFLSSLQPFRRLILLSGDVHYGFTVEAAYFGSPHALDPPARFVQLCSSSIRNSEVKPQLLAKLPAVTNMSWLGYDRDLSGVQAKLSSILDPIASGKYPPGPPFDSFDEAWGWMKWHFSAADRFSKPAVVPAGPWMDEEVMVELNKLPTPDWCYAVKYISEPKSFLQRYTEALAQIPTPLGVVGTVPLKMMARNNTVVIGDSNIGTISLQLDDSGLLNTVTHELHWRAEIPKLGYGPRMKSRHTASLKPPSDDEYPRFFKNGS